MPEKMPTLMRLILKMMPSILGLCMVGALAESQPLRCADLSMLDELESGRAVYTSQNLPNDAPSILKNHGLNSVRLRLFHTPLERRDGLDDMLALAQRANDLNLSIILNLHYSDTWADPGTQQKPSTWSQLSDSELNDSVYSYTYNSILALEKQGTPPMMVQTGNEITTGMLWDTGRVGGSYDRPEQWSKLARLLQSAADAVRDASSAKIMLHIDRGGDLQGANWFFGNLVRFSLDFDLIGLSYYPFWHGSIHQLAEVVTDLERRYQKPVILIETAYPWTLGWKDDMHNIVGLPEHVLPGYPATPEGQASFIRTLWEHVSEGICYWAPEYVATPELGSPWENLTLFNFEGEVLPGATALGGQMQSASETLPTLSSLRIFPNPVRMGASTVQIDLPQPTCVGIDIYNQLGQKVRSQSSRCQQQLSLSIVGLSMGSYWIRIPDMQPISLFVTP